jgi:hypothetical protein
LESIYEFWIICEIGLYAANFITIIIGLGFASLFELKKEKNPFRNVPPSSDRTIVNSEVNLGDPNRVN